LKDVAVIDQSYTTTDEQRATEWMTFESLAEALDPVDPSKTVEGWPAPQRVVVTATAA
jgi:tRNA (mo5U34)-methyltransferase